ncbi:hypothetical protein CERSUDRAFT_78171 [Gelatoporia subvermispora B]|uniref:F-box domain-containing protein n=1 Tax=Ceriporiopsis subvermispora (strain B) TaxID=914234 RepID=M2Q3L4_CERS8|nr:hypothetical protein CERSUDRAFT_78171 [Gelatoporia subvermispora B]
MPEQWLPIILNYDILRYVFEFSREVGDGPRTLACAARVCKAFLYYALDTLWSQLPSIVPLMMLLGIGFDDIWDSPESKPVLLGLRELSLTIHSPNIHVFSFLIPLGLHAIKIEIEILRRSTHPYPVIEPLCSDTFMASFHVPRSAQSKNLDIRKSCGPAQL